MTKTMNNAVTWNELANIYDKTHSRPARIHAMEEVFAWAERQTDKFFVDADGYLYLVASDAALASQQEAKPCDCGCQGTWGHGLTCMEEHLSEEVKP